MRFFSFFSIWIFVCSSIQAQKWTEAAPLPDSARGRHHPVTFAIDGFGYVGLGNSPDTLLDDFYKYDPVQDSWTELKRFPGGKRGFSIGQAHLGRGYLGFGINGNGDLLSELWEYNAFNDKWTQKANCPCAGRYHPAFVATAGKIYAGLGSSGNGNLQDWWEFDILSNTWTEKAGYPGARRHHPYQFAIFPYVYVGMGHGDGIYNDLFRYDATTDTWTEMKSLPDQGRVAGTQFDYLGKGYVLSGQGQTHDFMATGEFWEYDPTTNDWIQLKPHLKGESRWAPGSFVINNAVYFTCGENRGNHFKDVLKYEFVDISANKNLKNKIDFTAYPNPFDEKIMINIPQNILPQEIRIFRMDGMEIFHSKSLITSSTHITIETLRNFPPGSYWIEILASDGNLFRKAMVKL